MAAILLIEDDLTFSRILEGFLSKNNYSVTVAHKGKAGLHLFNEKKFDFVLLDYRLPDITGMEILTEIKAVSPDVPVLIMTSFSDIRTAVKAIKAGALEYITKPVNPDELLMLIRQGLEKPQKTTKAAVPEKEFVRGTSEASKQLHEYIRLVAPTDMSVIIEGESGTGKEYVARTIHRLSSRASSPFVAVDCGALSKELAASELFGHVKGAFTGAVSDKIGQFEAANGGTLMLDQLADMPAHLQTRLFSVLHDHALNRRGDELGIGVNFRLIVTISRNATTLLKQGVLKEDLYFCISTIKIKVPPLRERLDDIPLLAQHFLERFNTQYNKKIRGLSQEALFRLLRYDWPGNVRELESVIERAVLFCPGAEVVPDCLPDELRGNDLRNIPFVIPPLVTIEEIEREAIVQTLARTSGNVKLSAQILHYPRPTFYRKLKKFGIKVERD